MITFNGIHINLNKVYFENPVLWVQAERDPDNDQEVIRTQIMGIVTAAAGAFVALALFNYTKLLLFKKTPQPIVQIFDEERK